MTVSLIKGVQYSGEIQEFIGEEARAARRVYNKRFPLAKLVMSAIWRLQLDEIKLTNNKLGFGTKLVWQRDSEGGEDLKISQA